jgi:hypothetical protein
MIDGRLAQLQSSTRIALVVASTRIAMASLAHLAIMLGRFERAAG